MVLVKVTKNELLAKFFGGGRERKWDSKEWAKTFDILYPEGETPTFEMTPDNWLKLRELALRARPEQEHPRHTWVDHALVHCLIPPPPLMGFNFESMNLDGCGMRGGWFAKANLKDASLKHCNFHGCNFFGADVEDAVFENGVLSHCLFLVNNISKAHMEWCNYDPYTVSFPDGFDPEAAGMIPASPRPTNLVL